MKSTITSHFQAIPKKDTNNKKNTKNTIMHQISFINKNQNENQNQLTIKSHAKTIKKKKNLTK
jgi:hypothetical protein